MPENVTPLHDPPIERESDAPPALSPPAAPAVGGPEHTMASRSVLALPAASPHALPPEAYALLEIVEHGLAPDADESTRGAARDLWARFGQLLTAAPVMPAAMPTAPMMPAAPMMPTAPMTPGAPVMPAAPVMPTAPVMSAAPVMPTPPIPTTPIAMAARTLRQLPPDQLLELVLQRLRAAVPAGVTVPTPKGIQFQLVPIPSTPTADR